MAQSTRDVIEIVKSDDISTHIVTPHTFLDLEDINRSRAINREDGILKSPKTPLNSPRNSVAMAESPRLKRSPRHTDLTFQAGQASPPRDEGIADIEKRIKKNTDPNEMILTRGKSSGSFSGIFKVTGKDSIEQINTLKKSGETKTMDETVINSPRT